jgi:hypothetical protein
MTLSADDLQSNATAWEPLPVDGKATGQGAPPALPLRAESIERWSRAVAAPRPQHEATVNQEADPGAGQADPAAAEPVAPKPRLSSMRQPDGRVVGRDAEPRGNQGRQLSTGLPSPSAAQGGGAGEPAAAAFNGRHGTEAGASSPTPSPATRLRGLVDPKAAHDASAQEPAQAEPARAFSLSALRGLHASHRQGKGDAAMNAGSGEGSATQAPQAEPGAAWGSLPALGQPHAVSPEAQADGGGIDGAAIRGEQLQSLVESCCSRLWVSEGGGAPRGVMLDLGRWMPGCTIEVAKAAGVLRITLRGVEEGQRRLVEQELGSLGEGLAEKLGCRVVAAVAAQKEAQ